MLVKITSELSINPAAIVGIRRDTRHYVNGSESALIITMLDGKEHRLQHWPHGWDPVDIYDIERRLRMLVEEERS